MKDIIDGNQAESLFDVDTALEDVRTTTQRELLAPFLERVVNESHGCFYVSLLTSWNHIVPDGTLPPDISERITELDEDLEVKPSEVIDRVNRLKDILGLKVSRISIYPCAINVDAEQFRKEYHPPENVPVTKYTDDDITDSITFKDMEPDETGIILWGDIEGKKAKYHFTSLSVGHRFQGDESGLEIPNVGGTDGIIIMGSLGFLPLFIFHLEQVSQ
jgi:hypothetical protein